MLIFNYSSISPAQCSLLSERSFPLRIQTQGCSQLDQVLITLGRRSALRPANLQSVSSKRALCTPNGHFTIQTKDREAERVGEDDRRTVWRAEAPSVFLSAWNLIMQQANTSLVSPPSSSLVPPRAPLLASPLPAFMTPPACFIETNWRSLHQLHVKQLLGVKAKEEKNTWLKPEKRLEVCQQASTQSTQAKL